MKCELNQPIDNTFDSYNARASMLITHGKGWRGDANSASGLWVVGL